MVCRIRNEMFIFIWRVLARASDTRLDKFHSCVYFSIGSGAATFAAAAADIVEQIDYVLHFSI